MKKGFIHESDFKSLSSMQLGFKLFSQSVREYSSDAVVVVIMDKVASSVISRTAEKYNIFLIKFRRSHLEPSSASSYGDNTLQQLLTFRFLDSMKERIVDAFDSIAVVDIMGSSFVTSPFLSEPSSLQTFESPRRVLLKELFDNDPHVAQIFVECFGDNSLNLFSSFPLLSNHIVQGSSPVLIEYFSKMNQIMQGKPCSLSLLHFFFLFFFLIVVIKDNPSWAIASHRS